MYICMNCQAMFDSPNEVEDFTSEFWGARVRHMTSVCPNCGSDDFDEMDKCEICGEDINPGEELCENCRGLIKDIADEIRGKARYMTLRYKLKYDEFMDHLIRELDE